MVARRSESYAICKADMLIKGQDVANIVAGNTLSDDGHGHAKFDYSSPIRPSVSNGRRSRREVRREREKPKVSMAGSAPDCRECRTARCFSHMHLVSKCELQRTAAVGSGLSSTAPHYSQAGRDQGRKRNPPLRAGERFGRGDHRACRQKCSTK